MHDLEINIERIEEYVTLFYVYEYIIHITWLIACAHALYPGFGIFKYFIIVQVLTLHRYNV